MAIFTKHVIWKTANQLKVSSCSEPIAIGNCTWTNHSSKYLLYIYWIFHVKHWISLQVKHLEVSWCAVADTFDSGKWSNWISFPCKKCMLIPFLKLLLLNFISRNKSFDRMNDKSPGHHEISSWETRIVCTFQMNKSCSKL